MRTSIVIPTFNAGAEFPALLENLRTQKPSPPDEIVVIDSGSSDQTIEIARKAGAKVIENQRRYNHGATRDAGIAATSGDIVVLTVQDALPASPDWLRRITRHFDDPSVAGVSTRQIPPPDGPLELQIKAELEAAQTVARITLADHPRYSTYSPAQRLELYRFDNVSSALRRSVWEKLPFGDCRYAEDLLWARRALEAGHTLVRDPGAPVIHAHRRGFIYELRRALLDAWVLDEAFGYRYRIREKLGRARALGPSGANGRRPRMRERLGALKIYSAHVLGRGLYSGLRAIGFGDKRLSQWTQGI